MTANPDIAFEGILLDVTEQDGRKEGWVKYKGVLLLVDLTFVPSAKEGEKLLIHDRTALSRVEEGHEICG